MEITEVVGYEDHEIKLNPIYKFVEDKEKSTLKKVEGQLVRTKNKIKKQSKFLLAGIYDFWDGESDDAAEI